MFLLLDGLFSIALSMLLFLDVSILLASKIWGMPSYVNLLVICFLF